MAGPAYDPLVDKPEPKPAPDYTQLPPRILPEQLVESQPAADKPPLDNERSDERAIRYAG